MIKRRNCWAEKPSSCLKEQKKRSSADLKKKKKKDVPEQAGDGSAAGNCALSGVRTPEKECVYACPQLETEVSVHVKDGSVSLVKRLFFSLRKSKCFLKKRTDEAGSDHAAERHFRCTYTEKKKLYRLPRPGGIDTPGKRQSLSFIHLDGVSEVHLIK